MPRKRKLADLGERCRFCLARDACMTPLFDSKHLADQLKDVHKCTDVEITDKANYPKNVCHVCLYKLEMWSEFKSQFRKTNTSLISHFKLFEEIGNNSIISNETVPDDAIPDLSVEKYMKISQSPEKKKYSLDRIPILRLPDIKPIIDEAIGKVQSATEILKKVNQIPKKVDQIPKKVIEVAKPKQVVEEPKFTKAKEEEKNNASANQLSLSDCPSRSSKRLGRTRKFEREASTKRWVERKNALIVATGEKPSESESDNETQMSPAQKAREEIKQKRIEREMKYLHTNLNEKYCVKEEDMSSRVRTRSRRTIAKEDVSSPMRKSNVAETKVELQVDANEKEKSKEVVDVPTKEKEKTTEESPKDPLEIPEEEEMQVDKLKEEVIQKKQIKNVEKENVQVVENQIMGEDEEMEKSEPKEDKTKKEKVTNKDVEKNKDADKANKPKKINDLLKNDVITDLDLAEILNNNLDMIDKKNDSFTPQLVTSDVTIGNATYVITTTLDMPNQSTDDVSPKTNGINATSQGGKKIDIMNAVQLQKVEDETGAIQSDVQQNLETDIQKCLKIEIEGMEVEALQRVQLELAHFINENVRKRLMAEAEGNRKIASKATKFKDSYENLNHQLQEIIEKVLRNQYSSEKQSATKKVSPLFARLAKNTSISQPKVKVSHVNVSETRKDTDTSNLNESEDVKPVNRITGTTGRTAGKRKLVLPKKYENFALDLRLAENEVEEKKPVLKSTSHKTLSTSNRNNASLAELSNDVKSSDNSSSANVTVEAIEQFTTRFIKEAVKKVMKNVDAPQKDESEAASDSAVSVNIISTPAVIKSIPIATSTPAMSNKINKIGTNLQSPPSSPVTQVSKISISKKTVQSDIPIPSILASTKTNTTKRSNDDSKSSPPPKRERHLCGMCGKELFSTQEANIHMEQHRAEINNKEKQSKPTSSVTANVSNNNSSTLANESSNSSKPKPKLMRCKRCQAIVEAKHVKTHVCNSIKYNCDLCECTFGAQHLLIEHRQTHMISKSKAKMAVTSSNMSTSTSLTPTSAAATSAATKTMKPNPVKSNLVKEKRIQINVQENEQQKPGKKSESKLEKRSAKASEPKEDSNDDAITDESPKQCFVCDLFFATDELMKDHLQMHCEEVSESIEKDNFTCAFCANKFPNEEQLEEHVNVHLNEDGDEKISMMIDAQMEARRDRQRKPCRCEKCGETFPTASLLEMHAALHDEEEEDLEVEDDDETVAETNDGLNNPDETANELVCEICDEIFDTEAELTTHREAHNNNPHVCILCEMPFVSIKDLQDHVSTHL